MNMPLFSDNRSIRFNDSKNIAVCCYPGISLDPIGMKAAL
jgi:hypothetical protein